MGKRLLLFIGTNLAVITTISIVASFLGIGSYLGADGQVLYTTLAAWCLLWGMGGAFISLAISRWVAKRAYGIQLVDGQTGHPALDRVYQTVARLAEAEGLPMPEVGFYDSKEANAFATGPTRARSLVAVSSGLLQRLDNEAVDAVLAHEVAHIANGDMVTMTLVQGVVNAFVMFFSRLVAFAVRQMVDSRIAWLVELAVVIVAQIAFGLLGSLVTAAFSRAREFRADAGAARLTSPSAMVRALEQLRSVVDIADDRSPAMQSFKISSPNRALALLSTHPPLEARIAALQNSGR